MLLVTRLPKTLRRHGLRAARIALVACAVALLMQLGSAAQSGDIDAAAATSDDALPSKTFHFDGWLEHNWTVGRYDKDSNYDLPLLPSEESPTMKWLIDRNAGWPEADSPSWLLDQLMVGLTEREDYDYWTVEYNYGAEHSMSDGEYSLTLHAKQKHLDAIEAILNHLDRAIQSRVVLSAWHVDLPTPVASVSEAELDSTLSDPSPLATLQGVPVELMTQAPLRETVSTEVSASVNEEACAMNPKPCVVPVGEAWCARYLPRADGGGVILGYHAYRERTEKRSTATSGVTRETSSYRWRWRPFCLRHEEGEYPVLHSDALGRDVLFVPELSAPMPHAEFDLGGGKRVHLINALGALPADSRWGSVVSAHREAEVFKSYAWAPDLTIPYKPVWNEPDWGDPDHLLTSDAPRLEELVNATLESRHPKHEGIRALDLDPFLIVFEDDAKGETGFGELAKSMIGEQLRDWTRVSVNLYQISDDAQLREIRESIRDGHVSARAASLPTALELVYSDRFTLPRLGSHAKRLDGRFVDCLRQEAITRSKAAAHRPFWEWGIHGAVVEVSSAGRSHGHQVLTLRTRMVEPVGERSVFQHTSRKGQTIINEYLETTSGYASSQWRMQPGEFAYRLVPLTDGRTFLAELTLEE